MSAHFFCSLKIAQNDIIQNYSFTQYDANKCAGIFNYRSDLNDVIQKYMMSQQIKLPQLLSIHCVILSVSL